MRAVDLNCDLGEGGRHDAELMRLVTSANIACGGHAGTGRTMRAAVELAGRHGVAIGAHPGFADRDNFGRTEQVLSGGDIESLVTRQVRALAGIARAAGLRLSHVKPHGGLYNLAARDPRVADAVARAVRRAGRRLILVGLAGSRLPEAGRARGLRVAREAFADRAYLPDGSLVPRGRPGSIILDPGEAAAQALRIVREARVRALDGTDVPISADTICLHGDGPGAVAFARRLRAALGSLVVRLPR